MGGIFGPKSKFFSKNHYNQIFDKSENSTHYSQIITPPYRVGLRLFSRPYIPTPLPYPLYNRVNNFILSFRISFY